MKISIRSQTLELSPRMRRWARERAEVALERFRGRVHSVVVRLDDLNGPRGGVDKSCRIRISGPKLSIALEHRHDDAKQAISSGLRRVARTLERRRELDTRHPRVALAAGVTS